MKHLQKFENYNTKSSNKINEEISTELAVPAMSALEFLMGAGGGILAGIGAWFLAFGDSPKSKTKEGIKQEVAQLSPDKQKELYSEIESKLSPAEKEELKKKIGNVADAAKDSKMSN